MVQEEHVNELLSAYALECLDEVETAQVEAHLAKCETCHQELQTYREILDVLPLAMSESDPPPGLKAEIMRRARESSKPPPAAQPKPWWGQILSILRQGAPAWGLASLALIILLGVNNLFLWQRVNQLEKSQPVFMTVTLRGTENSPNASGLLVISQDGQHGSLVVDGLGALETSMQYQLWLIRDGQRTDGGVFSVDPGGYGSLWIDSEQPLVSYSQFGVTIEPAGGSPGPTGAKVLGGEL